MFLGCCVCCCTVCISVVWPSPPVSNRPLWSLAQAIYRICAVLSVFGVIQGFRVSRGILLINVSLGVNRVRLSSLTCSLVGLVEGYGKS